jgi:hypothetical protein
MSLDTNGVFVKKKVQVSIPLQKNGTGTHTLTTGKYAALLRAVIKYRWIPTNREHKNVFAT